MSKLGAFDASPLGAFTESILGARNSASEETGEPYAACWHKFSVYFCSYSDRRYTIRDIGVSGIKIWTPESYLVQDNDYILSGGVRYERPVKDRVFSIDDTHCDPYPAWEGWQYRTRVELGYTFPIPSLNAEELAIADIDWYRQDGTLVAHWTFSAPCYSSVVPCVDGGAPPNINYAIKVWR